MTDRTFFDLCLSLIPGIGPITAEKLIEHFGSAENFIRLPSHEIQKIPRIGKKAVQFLNQNNLKQKIDNLYQHADKYDYAILTKSNPAYPDQLKKQVSSPLSLYIKGKLPKPDRPFIAIVGTRKASEYGRTIIENLIKEIAVFNPVIISGLALGIDTFAHETALKHNLSTIAVLPTSIDNIYPKTNQTLAQEIVNQQGVLISEHPYFLKIDNSNFASRNRIIAGLANVVIVIEAPTKSGAIITAEFANDMNIEVMAVPGNIGKYNSEGCNMLIKKNMAHIYTKPQDLIDLMSWSNINTPALERSHACIDKLGHLEKSILDVLKTNNRVSKQTLKSLLKIKESELTLSLLELELENYIELLPGNQVSLGSKFMVNYS